MKKIISSVLVVAQVLAPMAARAERLTIGENNAILATVGVGLSPVQSASSKASEDQEVTRLQALADEEIQKLSAALEKTDIKIADGKTRETINLEEALKAKDIIITSHKLQVHNLRMKIKAGEEPGTLSVAASNSEIKEKVASTTIDINDSVETNLLKISEMLKETDTARDYWRVKQLLLGVIMVYIGVEMASEKGPIYGQSLKARQQSYYIAGDANSSTKLKKLAKAERILFATIGVGLIGTGTTFIYMVILDT